MENTCTSTVEENEGVRKETHPATLQTNTYMYTLCCQIPHVLAYYTQLHGCEGENPYMYLNLLEYREERVTDLVY